MVLACARDAEEARDVARHALEEGLVPVAAFDRESLLVTLDVLAGRALGPGESYNLAHHKTDAEMAALRAEASAG